MKKIKFFILGGMMLLATVSQAQVIEKVNGVFGDSRIPADERTNLNAFKRYRVLGIPADEKTNLKAFECYMSSYEVYQWLVTDNSKTYPDFWNSSMIVYAKKNSKGKFLPISFKKSLKLAGKDVKKCIKLCRNETLNAYMRWRWLRVQTDLKAKQIQELEVLKRQFKTLEQ